MHNSLLDGHVFKTYVGIDWLSCAKECDKEDMCFSYNYYSPDETCELNSAGLKDPCNNKQLLDEVFVISRIIKVEVRVISRSRRLRLITLTETLIILDITKTESNNCFIIH